MKRKQEPLQNIMFYVDECPTGYIKLPIYPSYVRIIKEAIFHYCEYRLITTRPKIGFIYPMLRIALRLSTFKELSTTDDLLEVTMLQKGRENVLHKQLFIYVSTYALNIILKSLRYDGQSILAAGLEALACATIVKSEKSYVKHDLFDIYYDELEAKLLRAETPSKI